MIGNRSALPNWIGQPDRKCQGKLQTSRDLYEYQPVVIPIYEPLPIRRPGDDGPKDQYVASVQHRLMACPIGVDQHDSPKAVVGDPLACRRPTWHVPHNTEAGVRPGRDRSDK